MEEESKKSAPSSLQTSMTLSINQDDEKRMITASNALNKRLEQLQQEMEATALSKKDEPAVEMEKSNGVKRKCPESDGDENTSVKSVVSTSDTEPLSSEDESHSTTATFTEKVPLQKLLVKAASTCTDKFISSFYSKLKESGVSVEEMETCLLLFLQMDKSTKLLSAFGILSKKENGVEKSQQKNHTTDTPSYLDHAGAVTLFASFLTSISACTNRAPSVCKEGRAVPGNGSQETPRKAKKGSENASPCRATTNALHCETTDWSDSHDNGQCLDENIRKEIRDVAGFAADRLISHHGDSSSSAKISFEDFGEWYNSGGYSVVPWLELLDLAKWKSAGCNTNGAKEKPPEANKTLAPIKEETNKDVHKEQEPKQKVPETAKSSLPAPKYEKEDSPILVSFDFTGAMRTSKESNYSPFCINITDENLVMLRNLVHRTGLSSRSPDEICNILLRHAKRTERNCNTIMALHRDDFGRCVRELVPAEASSQFSRSEMESFSIYFENFLSCFETGELGSEQVNAKELAVGFSFLCAGKKSAKLATGFDLLSSRPTGGLSQEELTQYLRSYLAMLVGISLLSSSSEKMSQTKKALLGSRPDGLFAAVENGARWTLGHFLKEFGDNHKADIITFENFAHWYTDGGYKVAPWLELLDLAKLLSLLGENGDSDRCSHGTATKSAASPKRRDSPSIPNSDVLFTFPLANNRSLVVLREDATYVRSVVEKMGLVQKPPEDVWGYLYGSLRSSHYSHRHSNGASSKTVEIDQSFFVSGMEKVILSGSAGRNGNTSRGGKLSSSTKETLLNFFQSFDLQQVGKVGLNQLMGGLTLLCGGKKSTKLAFAFGLFDSRNDRKDVSANQEHGSHSLDGEELFLFLRSFLIVMFSCCRQSLDLSAEAVSRYIWETAQMVAEDVMRYQWHTRKFERVNFDEFGEWYNEGGFETAPWLELLDLHKWVLNDDSWANQKAPLELSSRPHASPRSSYNYGVETPRQDDYPLPPPDEAVDPTFLGDMPMGSLDEMDYFLMQSSADKENDVIPANAFARSPQNRDSSHNTSTTSKVAGNSLKFNLVTNENHGGYMVSISQTRVRHFKQILTESGLCRIDAETACKEILSKASRNCTKSQKKSKPTKTNTKKGSEEEPLTLTKDDFDSAMRTILAGGDVSSNMSTVTQRTLSDLLACIFDAFDRLQTGAPNAVEVACGFTVLCKGKKSDKLEYAFELLDGDQDGKLSKRDMSNYLRSFLTALLSISNAPCLDKDESSDHMTTMTGSRCDRRTSTIGRAVDAGSKWAADQSFKASFKERRGSESSTFDDFAEWYTSVGYSSIPWLELLDLRKWVLAD